MANGSVEPLPHSMFRPALATAMKMKSTLLITGAAIVAMVAIRVLYSGASVAPTPAIEFVQAKPRWIAESSCAEMNDEERLQQELALKVFQAFPRISLLSIAAVRHFGQEAYRKVEKVALRLCPPTDLYPAVTEWALAQGQFSASHLFGDEVRLARALGPRDPRIVEAVARTAFHPGVIVTEYPLKGDIRSLARVTLAEFGDEAAQWSEQAYQAINADDALGTSAAQIAVATDHAQALEKVAQLLETILQQHAKNPIPRAPRDRFYELAYAMARAGPKAMAFADPIVKMMDRQVESWAPPYGMVSLRPRRMCRVLELIGGPDAQKALAREVCHPKIDVYEQ